MALTKKDFIILAEQLKTAKPNGRDYPGRAGDEKFSIATATWKLSVQAVMSACVQINDRFDREVFKKACGYDE